MNESKETYHLPDKKENPNKGHRERLRKRFLDSGRKALADHELLELLLTFTNAQKDTKKIAKDLLHKFGNLRSVIFAPPEEIIKVEGMGEVSATLVQLIKELHLHILESQITSKKSLSDFVELTNYFKEFLRNEKKEFFGVVLLDNKNQLLTNSIVKLQQGTVDSAPVYIREIIEHVINHKATRVIIVHNHPSGSPQPSKNDHIITQQIKESLKLINVELLDHIIVAGDLPPYSFSHFQIL